MAIWLVHHLPLSIYSELEKQRGEKDENYAELAATLQQLVNKQQKVTEDKFQMERQRHREQNALADLQQKFDQRMKDYEYEKEKEAVYLGDR